MAASSLVLLAASTAAGWLIDDLHRRPPSTTSIDALCQHRRPLSTSLHRRCPSTPCRVRPAARARRVKSHGRPSDVSKPTSRGGPGLVGQRWKRAPAYARCRRSPAPGHRRSVTGRHGVGDVGGAAEAPGTAPCSGSGGGARRGSAVRARHAFSGRSRSLWAWRLTYIHAPLQAAAGRPGRRGGPAAHSSMGWLRPRQGRERLPEHASRRATDRGARGGRAGAREALLRAGGGRGGRHGHASGLQRRRHCGPSPRPVGHPNARAARRARCRYGLLGPRRASRTRSLNGLGRRSAHPLARSAPIVSQPWWTASTWMWCLRQACSLMARAVGLAMAEGTTTATLPVAARWQPPPALCRQRLVGRRAERRGGGGRDVARHGRSEGRRRASGQAPRPVLAFLRRSVRTRAHADTA